RLDQYRDASLLHKLASLAPFIDATGSTLQRQQADLDATIERAALVGVVACDRVALTHAHHLEALALQALPDQVTGHGIRATLRQRLVGRVRADAVGMAADLDDRLV